MQTQTNKTSRSLRSPTLRPHPPERVRGASLSPVGSPILSSPDGSSIGQAQEAGRLMIAAAGDDPGREGVAQTPERFARAWGHLTAGYQQTPAGVIGKGIFSAEGQGIVSVRDVEFYSLCEHHMLPFWGTVSVAYWPKDKILGLSKIPRIVDVFARRLQVQERITTQVAEAIMDAIQPKAVAVRVTARHLCMMMRGVEKQQSMTISEASRGIESLFPGDQSRLFAALGHV